MDFDEPVLDADVDDRLERFWRVAVFHARLNGVPTYFGPTPLEVIRPPAWSYGETPADADRFVARLRGGDVTATAIPLADLEAAGEPLPQPGELGIVLDGEEEPRLLVAVSEVLLVPRAEVDDSETLVDADGAADDATMVVQRLRVLHAD